jgi:lipoprotein NlpI
VTLLICLGDDRMRRAQYVLLSLLLASPIASGGDAELLVDSARAALAAGKLDEAAAKAKQAIDASPADARPRLLLASIHEQRRAYRDAAMAYSDILSLKGLPLAPASAAEIHDRRGSAHFLAGEIDASIADFDKAIELDPGRLAGHWKRGISYYYAGRFAEGRRQFEAYQSVDANDVENAVWCFLCRAREESVEAAAKQLLPIQRDRRVPLMEIYRLFAGIGTAGDVLAAARAGSPGEQELRERLFFAQLYLGLWHEAHGRSAESLAAMRLAATHASDSGYMWEVPRVHLQLRSGEKAPE